MRYGEEVAATGAASGTGSANGKTVRFVMRMAVVIAMAIGLSVEGQSANGATTGGSVPSVRLYVLDCGRLVRMDLSRFSLQPSEVTTADLAVPCFLIVHPKGTLMWDVGAVPDSEWQPTGKTLTHSLKLPDGQSRDVELTKSLREQLLQIGRPPEKIDFLAVSHYHYDHTANANAFAHSTWLVREVEKDGMFAATPAGTTRPTTYSALRDAKAVIIFSDDYDVFHDGTVVIKFAPGHTPGHQVLALRLAHTGPVLLSGDLYHFTAERTFDRVPTFDFNADQTRASRVRVEKFLHDNGSALWIQHDPVANAKLRKAPLFYD